VDRVVEVQLGASGTILPEGRLNFHYSVDWSNIKDMFHYIYVLQSLKNGSLYIGYTNYLRRRLKQHNSGAVSYTKKYMPWKLIHYEAYRNEKDAKRREKYLKTSQGSRLLKRMLKEYFYKLTSKNLIYAKI